MASAHRSGCAIRRKLRTLCSRVLDDLVQERLLIVRLEPHGQLHGV